MENPNVIILAGPNGAGKSTISQELFGGKPDRPHYVNADTIARGLSAFRSEELALEAGRIMLDYLKKLGKQKANFALRRRYQRGLTNFFQLYQPIADSWKFYNNANPKLPILLAEGSGIIDSNVVDAIWHEIKKEWANG